MVKSENESEFLLAMAEQNGVACATVSDGHVLVFKRSTLEKILAQTEGKDTLTIFVKRPEMQS